MRICGKMVGSGEVVTLVSEGVLITQSVPGCTTPDIGSSDFFLSAGFHDIQLNGYGGYDFNQGMWLAADPDLMLDEIVSLVAQSGTALFCPTIITDSTEAICYRLDMVAELCSTSIRFRNAVTGIHLEGPWISQDDGPRGAHPVQHARLPDKDEFNRFQDAARGMVRIVTLAPELEGALGLIERLVEQGIVVAIGHTGATPEQVRAAISAGASMSTHLGNGCHAQLSRHDNYLWEQMADDALIASVIADGHHLPPSSLKVITRAKGIDRLILVSDAVALGGLSAGHYADGKFEVLTSGRINLAGTPYLAGAGHLLDVCIANTVRNTDLTLEEAIYCATSAPAKLLGFSIEMGSLNPGNRADFTLFKVDDLGELQIEATLCAGEIVYRRAE